jgi:ATP-dependent protease ClpP protease subunit
MKKETAIDITGLIEKVMKTNALDPIQYQYFKNLEKRKIILNDEISSSIVETVIIPLLEFDNDGTGEPIEILLSCCGGSVFDSFILCNIIEQLKTPTTITIFGYAYSMAGIILTSGFYNPNVKRRCYKFSTALIHSGETLLQGNSFSVKDTFHFQDKFDNTIKEYILSHSKITIEEYNQMERCEWYMTSDEMLEKGLVDEIIGSDIKLK